MAHELIHFNPVKLRQAFPSSAPEPYWDLVHVVGVPLLDRTRTLQTNFCHEVLDEVPGSDDCVLTTFPECCEKRAYEIIQVAAEYDRAICVYWSGGIDSTTALVALLKAEAPRLLSNNFIVYYNHASFLEYPRFFDEHIRGKLNTFHLTDNPKLEWNPNDLTVTGELGDQIFGSAMLQAFLPTSARFPNFLPDANYRHDVHLMFEEPWQKWIRTFFANVLNSEKRADAIIDYLLPLVYKCPFVVSNAFDFWWWINFTCKWQDVSLRFVADYNYTPAQFRNVKHFFNTPHFQRWAMDEYNHRNLKICSSAADAWASYKREAKKYIAEFTGDWDYADYKLKVGSLRAGITNPYVLRLADHSCVMEADLV